MAIPLHLEQGTPGETTTLESGVRKALFSLGRLMTKAEEAAKDHAGTVTGAGQLPYWSKMGNFIIIKVNGNFVF